MAHRIALLTARLTALGASMAALALVGCAQGGAHSPDARPVLYPNAAYKRMGESQTQSALDACIVAAHQTGLTPEDNAAPAKEAWK